MTAGAASEAIRETDLSAGAVVLLVDDQPHSVSALHDVLDEAGFTVLVALDGSTALQRAREALPDVILLDAVMPGIDGFEVARRLQADPRTQGLPIIFMTGLSETEDVERAFAAGGVDYVTKPVRPREVLARLNAHRRLARQARWGLRQDGLARQALDAFGLATLVLRGADGKLLWQTPLARALLVQYAGGDGVHTPETMRRWWQAGLSLALRGEEPPPLVLRAGADQLVLRVHRRIGDLDDELTATGTRDAGDWLIVLEERRESLAMARLVDAFGLTVREAEVLYWVAQGKINRDIGAIVGASPATVKKHLERILAKLGVETRTAAAAMALQRLWTP